MDDRRGAAQRALLTTYVRYGKMQLVGQFKTDRAELRLRDRCIVKTDRGRELGTIIKPLEAVAEGSSADALGEIVRKATPDDLRNAERIEKETRPKELTYCKEEVRKLNLPMKVVEVDHLFGGERVVIYFVSETRVDFRELVRRLAHEFRTRIELKQVGARDHARLVGDVGMCGLETPCRTYLKELGGISMDMAKLQKHTADPSKITGVCGKLRCCLRFEYPAYLEARDLMPPKGIRIETRKGNGHVVESNLLLREVTIVKEGTEDRVIVRLDEIQGMPAKAAGCGGCAVPAKAAVPAAEEERAEEAGGGDDTRTMMPAVVAEPPTGEFLPAAKAEEVPVGTSRAVEVGGRAVALFNVEGTIYATEAACPHQGVSLVEGTMRGIVVRCAGHGWQFNVASGEGVSGPSRLKTYEVKVENGQVFVRL